MARHNTFGKWGEQVAIETLVGKGYAIRETNWRRGHYEIDIVAMKGTRIVFVEVKTRSASEEDAVAAVDRRKINRMVLSANTYVNMYDLPNEVQYDVITIVGTPEDYTLHHIEDAFFAPLRSLR